MDIDGLFIWIEEEEKWCIMFNGINIPFDTVEHGDDIDEVFLVDSKPTDDVVGFIDLKSTTHDFWDKFVAELV